MKKISLMKKTRDILGHPFGPILALIGLMSVATFVLQPDALAQDNPSWTPTGSLNTPRSGHTATLLGNGKVLVVGGDSAELYDPVTGVWNVTGSLNTVRDSHTATLLQNGKVLVVGSDGAELYDPNTGTWSITGSLNAARSWYTATLLQNGKVLAAGGWGSDSLASAELYDPNTGTWSVTGSLIDDNQSRGFSPFGPGHGRYGHTATLLQNGKVLVTGGSDDGDLASTLASAELYDPATGTWSVTGNLNVSRIFHSATLLPEGRVLVVGGYTDNWVPANGGFAASPTSLNSAELYDPATGTWSMTGSLNTRSTDHTATLLQNGKVLVAGGDYWTIDGITPNDGTYPCGITLTCSAKGLNTAELYDVATGTWSVTANLNTARLRHTATLLANGKVLVAAGCNLVGHTCLGLNSAELYNSHLSASVDFDGDGKSDIGIYRDGVWFILRSSDGSIVDAGWGGPAWMPVMADYDGDGKVDIAVYNANGLWSIVRSSDGGNTLIGWSGAAGDVPVPADYDGDGKADLAVYNSVSAVWSIIRSSDGGLTNKIWGGPSWEPVVADYDGDGKADIAVYNANGLWSIVRSSDGGNTLIGWSGAPGDIPVPADYDGDGKADLALYNSASGVWSIIRSSDGGLTNTIWGGPAWEPVAADYDGDGKADIAVYNPTNGLWSIVRSSDGGNTLVGLGGAPQDIPIN